MGIGRTWLDRPSLKVGTDGSSVAMDRRIPEEIPVAVVHDGTTHAVMMATPDDLEDFAVGFSFTEGVIAGLGDIASLDILEVEAGIEARLWLAEGASRRAADRRRLIAGPTGCGLCGVESLEMARRPVPDVGGGAMTVGADAVLAAADALSAGQSLGRTTRATHAAGLATPDGRLLAVREDVGRHNALDKLAGWAIRRAVPAGGAIVVISSRVSVEMVQKTAALGAPVLVAVSAPTGLAVETAEAAGITLCAVARRDGFEVFTRPERIRRETRS